MAAQFLLSPIRQQLSVLAKLRAASAEFSSAFDDYFQPLARGEVPSWDRWSRVESTHAALVRLLAEFNGAGEDLKRAAHSERMADLARARYMKGSNNR